MAEEPQSIIDTRREQMFPKLSDSDLRRIARFGECRPFRKGEALVEAGEVGHGLYVLLSGHVEITQHDESGRRPSIVIHGPGSFMGELAQLSGRPALVDGT